MPGSSPPLLAALAAAFLPSRAQAILARQPDLALAREAARLSGLSREERLAALAEALEARPRPADGARERAAAHERPRLAACVRAGSDAGDLRPLMRRVVLESAWR